MIPTKHLRQTNAATRRENTKPGRARGTCHAIACTIIARALRQAGVGGVPSVLRASSAVMQALQGLGFDAQRRELAFVDADRVVVGLRRLMHLVLQILDLPQPPHMSTNDAGTNKTRVNNFVTSIKRPKQTDPALTGLDPVYNQRCEHHSPPRPQTSECVPQNHTFLHYPRAYDET